MPSKKVSRNFESWSSSSEVPGAGALGEGGRGKLEASKESKSWSAGELLI